MFPINIPTHIENIIMDFADESVENAQKDYMKNVVSDLNLLPKDFLGEMFDIFYENVFYWDPFEDNRLYHNYFDDYLDEDYSEFCFGTINSMLQESIGIDWEDDEHDNINFDKNKITQLQNKLIKY
jgi:hypothetical protein